MRRVTLTGFLGAYLLTRTLAQTWYSPPSSKVPSVTLTSVARFLTGIFRCGKHYESTQSAVTPGGNFPLPSQSSDPLLAFRCVPAIRPYLDEDVSVNMSAAILIDALVVYYNIANAEPIQLSSADSTINVTVSWNGGTLTSGSVPLNAIGHELSFDLGDISPQMAAYNLSCEATYGATRQTFSATTPLYVLPNPTNSSVTKMDLRTGALLAKPVSGTGGTYEPVFPIGFHTLLDDNLTTNLSLIDELKDQGFTVIHPVPGNPTFDNLTALDSVIDRMQEVGLYLMYDMRYTYMNATSVSEQVNYFKNRSNLLLWYTADEPDGTSDPLNATTSAYDLIYKLDGYHPVSLVLNCQDYYWASYTAGTDVVMQDVHMVGNNVSWSNVWNTTCTPDYGDCGCDSCLSIPAGNTSAVPPNSTYFGAQYVPANSGIGSYFDISDRVTSFKYRLEVMGWDRSKTVWTDPQAFRANHYWSRAPTGEEWVVQTIMGINQGAMGVVSSEDPTPADVKSAASTFALSLPKITPYLLDPTAVRWAYVVGGLSMATWNSSTSNTETLVLAANTYYINQTVSWEALGLGGANVTTVFVSGAVETEESEFTLGPVGSAAFLVSV